MTGVTENPFLDMGVNGGTKKGNRATARAEYNLYRTTAREMGYQSLYPELEEELARSLAKRPDGADFIVLEERSGAPYKERRVSQIHRAICDKAGLPKEMTFTGFRHGGITEIGNAGEADPRAVSGHKTLAVTGIYNKANEEKARRIAAARREHIALLGAENEG